MSLTVAASAAADPEQEQIEVGTHLDLTAASPTWQDVALRRRDEINNAIPLAYRVSPSLLTGTNFIKLPELSGILSQKELDITSLTATRLLKCIHSEVYTAVEVTTAFCKRSAIAHQATNCLAFILFEQALADAAVLDEHMATHHTPIGPLHGLPISVKEHVDLANTPSTSGFVTWADNIAKHDSLIVKVLREAGAVFHVKTTNPQALMALETVSNLYGTTTNPHNTNLTPGGSSGGEGALIAMRGSLLGIGTDIGGSIRAPAAFSGIYGLKPSISRLPHSGLAGVHGGMENIIGAVGPMATSSEDLQLFSSVVLNSKPWLHEPSLIELPWRHEVTIPKTLRIGIMYHDGVVTPHPPITRCLREAARKLQNAGHVLIPWEPKCHQEIVDTINEAYFLDGGEEYHEVLAEGNEPAVALIAHLLSAPYAEKHRSARDTWKVNKRRNALQDLYAREWNEKDLDFLLCPVNASVGSRHGESTYWGYTSVFNLLDYTGAVLPVGTVGKGDTWENFLPGDVIGEEDQVYRDYYTGPERYEGAPVALQVVTRRFGEERALLFIEEIERALGL